MKRVVICVVCAVLVCALSLPVYASSLEDLPEGGQSDLSVDTSAYPDGLEAAGSHPDESPVFDSGSGDSDADNAETEQGGYYMLPGTLLTYDQLQSLLEPSEPSGFLSYDDFISYNGDDYSVSVIAVQTSPNTPVTPDGKGLKSILLTLFGDYSPVITQLRYQANNNTTYTYVNDIHYDVPWIASAVIFALVLFCTFKLGGTLFCKT